MKVRKKPKLIIDIQNEFGKEFKKVPEREIYKMNRRDPLRYSLSEDDKLSGIYIVNRFFSPIVLELLESHNSSIHMRFITFVNCNIGNIDFIKSYQNLEYLSLWKNNIKDIKPISQLSQLSFLNLSDNNIDQINSVKYLRNIKTMIFSKNKITNLPLWICDFNIEFAWKEKLSANKIHIYGNPLQIPPAEIASQGDLSIRNYFEQINITGNVDYLNEAKLLLVGEERAGKSTLGQALRGDGFQINTNNQSTEGIDIFTWEIPEHEVGIKDGFKFNVWDFGGQEIYHSTHQFFLTKRSLYLFITEARKDLRFDDFYYWLNIVSSLAGSSPMLVVQNKIDQPHKDHSISEYKKYFPQIQGGLIKVSCNTVHEYWENKYSLTIEFLKQSIYKIIKEKKIKGMGEPLPRSWVEIRKEIKKLSDNGIKYISLNEYINICKKKNINYYQALYLSDFYHDLGVFLHFKNDLHLRNTIFLDHEWVTMAVYKVLDSEEVKETFGKFTDSQLIRLWTGEGLDNKRPELLSLMKNKEFNICYEHPEGFYLAPQLFDDEPIEYNVNRLNRFLNFRYRYKFMPKGILPKLIVMLNDLILDDMFWQYGVVLKYKESTALIKEMRFKNENLIDIQSTGINSKDLLVIIGNSIESINKTFSNLDVTEEFSCHCNECKGKENPYFFKSTTINRALDKGIDSIECQISFDRIKIDTLLGYFFTDDYFERYVENDFLEIENIYHGGVNMSAEKELLDKLGVINEKIDNMQLSAEYLLDKLSGKIPEKNELIRFIDKMIATRNSKLLSDLTNWLEIALGVIDQGNIEDFEEMKEMFILAKKSSNFEVKAKITVPIINLLGLHIETKFDLLNFAKDVKSRLSKGII